MKHKALLFILFFLASCSLLLLIVRVVTPSVPSKAQDKILQVGYANEPPYAHYDESGQVNGLFPAVVKKMLKPLGYDDIEWIMMNDEQLLQAIKSNRIDVIASGIEKTPQHKSAGCFLSPLTLAKAAVMIREDEFTSEALKPSNLNEKTLVTVSGSAEEDLARQLTTDAQLETTADVQTGVSMVMSDEADALLLSRPTLEYRSQYIDSVENVAIKELKVEPMESSLLFSFQLEHNLEKAQQIQNKFMNSQLYSEYLNSYDFIRPIESDPSPECGVSSRGSS